MPFLERAPTIVYKIKMQSLTSEIISISAFVVLNIWNTVISCERWRKDHRNGVLILARLRGISWYQGHRYWLYLFTGRNSF